MTRNEENQLKQDQRPFLKRPAGWIFVCLLAVGAAYLATQHTAHVSIVLPYLFVLACPLMHVFMHHNHGSHKENRDEKQDPDVISRDDASKTGN